MPTAAWDRPLARISRAARGPLTWRHFPLETRLIATFVGLTLLLTTLLYATISDHVSRRSEAVVGASLEQLAYQLADKLDRNMFERYRDIQVSAQLIGRYSTTPDTVWPLLNALQVTFPRYAWIGLTDATGRVQASTGALLEGADVSARDWFHEGRRQPFVGDVHNAKLLAKPLPGAGEEPLRFVDIATPVRTASGHTGVLGAHLDWRWAADLQRYTLAGQAKDGTQIMVLSRNGTVLLGPPGVLGTTLDIRGAQRRAGEVKGNTLGRWPDGKTYVHGFAHTHGYQSYPGLGWTVIARQEAGLAYAPVRQMQFRLLLLAGLGAMTVSVVSMLVARQIARPLNVLTRAAERLLNNPHDVPHTSLRVDGYREVRGLSRTLQSLLGSLAAQRSELLERNEELTRAKLEILTTLARATEYRDDDTGQHIARVGRMAGDLARRLGVPEAELIELAAPLHDVGKIGIPDAILLKPGPLTPQEYEQIKQHTVMGEQILRGSHFRVLQLAAVIALTHHERWDGSGYPAGLRGEETPLVGRIVAVVDVFDALTSERAYKAAWSREAAVEEIVRQAGRQFDPRVVQAFEAWVNGPEQKSDVQG